MKASVTLTGILCAVTAMACFAVLDTTNKILVAGVPLLMILWVRYMFQAIATSAMMLRVTRVESDESLPGRLMRRSASSAGRRRTRRFAPQLRQ